MKKKQIILIALLLCVLARLLVSPLPIDESISSGGDQGGYLHFAWFMKAHPGEMWDHFWYGGMTATSRFYPPLIFQIQAILANFLGDIISYKLVILLSFALAPLAFYYLLKEFKLSEKERIVSTAIFTFAMIYNVSFFFGKASALSSVLFGLIAFKFFIKSLKGKDGRDILLSSFFLALSILTHSVASILVLGITAIYLASVLFVRFNVKKLLRGLLVYASAFLLSAYWIIPALLERKYTYFLIFSESGQSFFNIFPFTGIVRTFGYYVNLYTIVIGLIASVLMLYGFIVLYRAYKKRRNDESLFFMASSIALVFGYFLGFYLLQDAILAPEASVILWPVILSVLIAKSMTKRVFSYLVIVFIALMMVSFFGTSMEIQSKEHYSRFDGALTYLQDKDGRISFQPFAPYGMITASEYRSALFDKETDFGNFPQSMPSNRIGYIDDNFGFNCVQTQSVMDRVTSTDFLNRENIKLKPCELINPKLEDYFYSMNVHYVVTGKEFPEVMGYFEGKTDYKKVYEDSAAVVYNFTRNPSYLRASGLSFTYYRLADKIVIDLKSDSELENVDVWISESWYPMWTSADVQNIRADDNGFMVFTVPEINGENKVTLEYKTPEFYNYLPLLTFIWLALLIVNVRFDLLRTRN